MQLLNCVNVNDGYVYGFDLLRRHGVYETSRAGAVYSLQVPLAVVYEKPQQRVLFDAVRDANPFFHLFESLWLLAGRNDAKWLDQFVGDFSTRFAEEDGRLHGSYGFRWRQHFDNEWGGIGVLDQLSAVVRLLKENPDDRRVVIQMWDPNADLEASKKDVPCNLVVVPRVRTVMGNSNINSTSFDPDRPRDVLDITVFNRSNDICWGLFGANAVQFSFLQEYLAGRIGVGIGRYTQISTNAHLYEDHVRKYEPYPLAVRGGYPDTRPIGKNWGSWDYDLQTFMEWSEDWEAQPPSFPDNPWFADTALPLFASYKLWKQGDRREARELLDDSAFDIASDWKIAAAQWMDRRAKKVEAA